MIKAGTVPMSSMARPSTMGRRLCPLGILAASSLGSLAGAAVVLMLGSVLWAGCQGDPPAPTVSRLALEQPADAAAKDSLMAQPGCGRFPPVGCCEGEALWWCEQGLLKSLNCAGRPLCGWSNAGIFDCNTSGQADPSGNYSRSCPRDDAGTPLPSLDTGVIDGAPDACGEIPVEGCCAGDELRYCLGGVLRRLDCTLNRACGWKANGGLYDCGTGGGEDPSGNFLKSCPGAADAQVDLGQDLGQRDLGGDTESDTGPGPGCACGLPALTSLSDTWMAAGLLLLLVMRRRGRQG